MIESEKSLLEKLIRQRLHWSDDTPIGGGLLRSQWEKIVHQAAFNNEAVIDLLHREVELIESRGNIANITPGGKGNG